MKSVVDSSWQVIAEEKKMNLTLRTFGDEGDYWRIRAFLRDVFLRNGRRERSWHVNRFDYWRWHGVENLEHYHLEEVLFLWERRGGKIVGMLNPEGRGEVFLHVHPGYRTPDLEEAMIATAEEHLAIPRPEGSWWLCVWAHADDAGRQSILQRYGYTKGTPPEIQLRRLLTAPIPEAPLPNGYTLRPLGDGNELPGRSWASWKAFHPDEPEERYSGWAWYQNIQRCPLYRRDLDLVAVAPDGEIAGFCTAWFDDVTRSGCFEPVGVAPAHQRHGLGKAMLYEGFRQLKRLGATIAFVGSYNPDAHALYQSAGFSAYDLSEPWVKEF